MKHIVLLVVLSVWATAAVGADRPNVLWLTFEDTSPKEFGCYGNDQVDTPVIDGLAARGVQYAHAYSVAPHCSPARSTIISGCFATTYGTDWHRKGWDVPGDRYFFPALLREAGYFTTNNNKTDYNVTGQVWRAHKDRTWSVQGREGSYTHPDRAEGQPFFAVFNSMVTHMGRLRSFGIEGRRVFDGPQAEAVILPPHVPDLPEVRSDYAFHLEGSQDIDRWVKIHLDKLEELGLADDTIVFVFSDHGGCLPRGKGFPYETGLQVPMVVYVPPKWQEELGVTPGMIDRRLVGFEDLAPTLLTLAGAEVPEYMQGQSIFAANPRKTIQFGFRTNTQHHYDPIRTATDGRYKYIRSYTPYKPLGMRQTYQWGAPSHYAWDVAFRKGELSPEYHGFFQPKPHEQLFDMEDDPWELNNVADRPEYQQVLETMRDAVSQHVRDTKDLGLFPNTTRVKADGVPLHDWVRDTDYPLEALYRAAEMAGRGNPADAHALTVLLSSDKPELRFWGAAGLANLAQKGELDVAPGALIDATRDRNVEVSITAAEALCYLGEADTGLPVLMGHLKDGTIFASSSLEALGPIAEPLLPQLQQMPDSIYARSLLINLGQLPYSEYFDAKTKQGGAKVNADRRNWRSPAP